MQQKLTQQQILEQARVNEQIKAQMRAAEMNAQMLGMAFNIFITLLKDPNWSDKSLEEVAVYSKKAAITFLEAKV